MYPLKLDYAAATVLWTRQGLLCLLLGLSLTAGSLVYYQDLRSEHDGTTEALAAIQKRMDREQRKKDKLAAELKSHRAEIQEAGVVMKRLTIPWDALFGAVEQVGARHLNQIALLAIHPDVDERRVVIDGRSADLDVLLDFVAQLRDSRIIRNAHLAHHHLEPEKKDRGKPVKFTVVAEWNTQS